MTAVQVLDPVCRMTIDLETQRGKGLVFMHAGKEYAFCAPSCKRSFERDPQQYLR